jgi:N-glycosylase/DNA lyase
MVSTPRFVPARQAYLGDAMMAWLADPRASKERWLVLSARYGFIDPDQPIENYDVTFKDSKTGPITVDALAAQVRYQVRWADRVPFGHFSRVVVHGHKDYLDRVRAAFSATGTQVVLDDAHVEPDGAGSLSVGAPPVQLASTSASTAKPVTTSNAFTWSSVRATTIGQALGKLPFQVFSNFDRAEPEWPVLQRLAAWSDQPLASLTAICLGIADYQLGAGAAAGYWEAVMREIDRRPPQTPADVVDLMTRVRQHLVSVRFADQKLVRVEKIVRSWSDRVPSTPEGLWKWLGQTLGQSEEAKTVVMAMKLIDLLELARTGRYLDFGPEVPLPIDLRIVRISLTSGLIASGQQASLNALMGRAGDIASVQRQLLIDAWRAVAKAAGGLQLLRIDSLAWQIAESVGSSEWESTTTWRLIEAGSSPDAARRLAAELNWAASGAGSS